DQHPWFQRARKNPQSSAARKFYVWSDTDKRYAGTRVIFIDADFIKSVEDIHETLVGAVPGIKFGLAFCEASGKCLVRSSGTDVAMVQLAQKNAMALGAGHCFIVFLGEGYYPVNVLNAIKKVPEVCRIFCATANPLEVVVAETDQGRGLFGVISGSTAGPVASLQIVGQRHGIPLIDNWLHELGRGGADIEIGPLEDRRPCLGHTPALQPR